MKRRTVRALHVGAVLIACLGVLEGPDLLLLGIHDARYWAPLGFVSGVLTLPLLWVSGVAFAPPWTLPAYRERESRWRVAGYHLVCTTMTAWLWTYPTRLVVAWVHRERGLSVTATVPTDLVSVAVGLLLAELLLFVLALILFVRLTSFQTSIELAAVRVRDLAHTGVVALGSPLVVAFVLTLLGVAVRSP